MITNEFQKKKTLGFINSFEKEIKKLKQKEKISKIEKLQITATLSQIDDLKIQVQEYENIKKSGKKFRFNLSSLENLPEALIKARIASDMTQKELASKLNMKEQQLQKYESNEYRMVNLKTLIYIGKIMNLRIKNGNIQFN